MAVALRQAVPVAVRYLHNHDILNCSVGRTPDLHLYSGRALGISEPWDMVQLHPDLEPLWPAVHAHYQRVGLSHSEHILWHTVRASLGEHIGFQPSVFHFGPEEYRYWGDHQWLDVVEFVDTRNNFIALAEELGVPPSYTRCFEGVERIDPEQLSDGDFPCYLKAANADHGEALFCCEDRSALTGALQRFGPGTQVRLQREIEADYVLNLQYRVRQGRLERLDVAEQLLDGPEPLVSRAPACCQPWRLVDPMAEWLADRGMRGVFSFDVSATQTDAGIRFEVLRCNPRFNAISYPVLIALKLGITEWSSHIVTTSRRDLVGLDLTGLEYQPARAEGVILVNWGSVLAGKMTVMLAGPAQARDGLLQALQSRLDSHDNNRVVPELRP